MHRRPKRRQRAIKFIDGGFVGEIYWRFDVHMLVDCALRPTSCRNMADRARVNEYLNDGRPQRAGSAGYYNMAACEIEVEHFAISFYVATQNTIYPPS